MCRTCRWLRIQVRNCIAMKMEFRIRFFWYQNGADPQHRPQSRPDPGFRKPDINILINKKKVLRTRDWLSLLDPDPTIFVIDLQDANKEKLFYVFCFTFSFLIKVMGICDHWFHQGYILTFMPPL
jgi:hypothetical protein